MKLFNFNAKDKKIKELEKNIQSLSIENENLKKANKAMANLVTIIRNKSYSLNDKIGV